MHGLEGVYIANFQDNIDFDVAYDDKLHDTKRPTSVSHNSALMKGEGQCRRERITHSPTLIHSSPLLLQLSMHLRLETPLFR